MPRVKESPAASDAYLVRTLAAVAVLAISMTAVAVAQAPPISAVGALKAPGVGITRGPDGALWHTSKQAVGFTTTAGQTTEFDLPSYADAGAITAGPDGALWFVHHVHAIGRVTTTGTVSVFDDLDAEPHGIAFGPDGNLWYAATDKRSGHDKDAVARLTPAGDLTIYGGSFTEAPVDITAGPDGALWVTEPDGGRVGRITTTGAVTEVPVGGEPTAIVAGPDGALWFTDDKGKIGRVTTDGSFTMFSGAGQKPGDIAAGPDGALWYTLAHGVGRISAAGAITTYDLGEAEPVSITAGPDAAVYYTDAKATALGRIDLTPGPTATDTPVPTATDTPVPTATATPSPTPITTPTPVAPVVPKLQETVVVAPARGRVRVRPPGGRFKNLVGEQGIPVGSLVDTRRGTVALQSAIGGGTQSGTFRGGVFKVRQLSSGRTDILLRGRLECSRALASAARTTRKQRRRKVWGKDDGGSFTTHGRDSVTTVRGTEWLTLDTCRGTVTRVRSGKVVVRDRRTGKRHVVRAGHTYLARHRP